MNFNLDFLAAIGSLFAGPPLVAACLAVAAMLFLWLTSRFLKFAQIALGALAVFYLVRFALDGGLAAPVPVQAGSPAEASAAGVPTPTSLPTTLPPGTEMHVDTTGITIHVPFAANQSLQSVQTLLRSNQTEIQRVLAAATPTDTAVDTGQKVAQPSD